MIRFVTLIGFFIDKKLKLYIVKKCVTQSTVMHLRSDWLF